MVSYKMRFGCRAPKTACFEKAFSLVELLFVIAILILILSFLVPSISGIKNAGDLSSATYVISDVLAGARASAIAQNTYVWVGLAEVDQSLDSSAMPQRDGVGRVAVSVIASKDGTRIYDETQDVASDWSAKTADGAGLVQIGKLLRIENIHCSAGLGVPPSGGSMTRPTVDAAFQIGAAECESVLTFTYPLGNPPHAQYFFRKVIQFDPRGTARIVKATGSSLSSRQIEISLLATRGNVVLSTDGGAANQAALQVECLTGATSIYRP